MDANMADLIGGVLSNPEMMNKVKTLLPLVSQMVKSDTPQPVENAVSQIHPAPVINQPVQPANIMFDENVADAIQNLIAALSSASPPPQIAGYDAPGAQQNQEAVPVFAQTQQPPDIITPPPQSEPVNPVNIADIIADTGSSINIEKTLDTLKNVTAVANPENDHRAKLLLSLKPFLNESRRIKIDTAIKYINAAKILTSFGKNGFLKQ